MRLEGHVPGDVGAELPHALVNMFRGFLKGPVLKEP